AAAGSVTSSRTDPARRGDLLDRRGRVVATSSIGYRLFVDPQEVEDLATIAVDLAHLLGTGPVEIDRRIQERRDRRYVVVAPLLADWQVEAVRRASLRGVGLEPRLVRHYPNDELGAGVIGKVGHEHTGQGGFEHLFDDALEGADGRLTYLRDARRQALWIDAVGYEPAKDGGDVWLSMDLVIQEIAERRLGEALGEYRAAGGRLTVVDCRTGELLAMCDLLNPSPRFEPIEDAGRDVHPALGRNRCATDPYEPGSTFKPFVWSVAVELGRATPEEVIDCPENAPWRTPYGRRIRDSHYAGPVPYEEVLVRSLNTGMAMVAERMSHAEMQGVLDRFGFGRRTSSGLPGESAGIVTTPADWSSYTQSSLSFGHEIAVTTLQMARAFCAFARDGTVPLLRTTAVQSETDEQPFIQRAIEADTARRTREALRRVITDGTGRRARSSRYTLFGKSGTPQLARREGGGYHEDRYVPTFIAGAPFEDPQIVVLCVIDDPDRSVGHWGGTVAGPVVRDVIDEVLSYLGVEPDETGDVTTADQG
ncbi:MAG: peptidoglycan D,D-transpeptidase FtsI family protein, partial [Planctomycetota bacterium]